MVKSFLFCFVFLHSATLRLQDMYCCWDINDTLESIAKCDLRKRPEINDTFRKYCKMRFEKKRLGGNASENCNNFFITM